MYRQTQINRQLQVLSEGTTSAILTLTVLLDRGHFPGGPWRHQLAADWMNGRFATLDELLHSLGTTRSEPRNARLGGGDTARLRRHQSIERAALAARRQYPAGMKIARLRDRLREPESACPRFLFLVGKIPSSHRWTAVFNSRKARRLAADASWLEAIRTIIAMPAFKRTGWVGSSGTLSYELIATHARSTGSPLLMIGSEPLLYPLAEQPSPNPENIILSCHIGGPRCDKKVRLVCRDRILAQLSDWHVAIEIRPGGNLLSVLAAEQTRIPRSLWIFDSPSRPAQSGGNRRLREMFPTRTQPFTLAPGPGRTISKPESASQRLSILKLDPSRRHDYLYHYTRACPGPWPAQSREAYHLELLSGQSGCEHSALDSLCRILLQQRLRAGDKMVKGEAAVVCWSARSPEDLAILRKWRSGLVRWTLEPYGIAVQRKALRKLGAKPAIYSSPSRYGRLKPADRYRYQRHDPPHCDWKQEREWRLAGDLELVHLDPTEAFIMVPDLESARQLASRISPIFPIVLIAEEHA